MGTLDGRVAIVTGGARGLGRAHCLELARQGAVVIIVDPGVELDGSGGDESSVHDVVREIVAGGGTARAVGASVTDYLRVASLVEEVVGDYGRLDIVVNNAGITRDRMITSMEERDWDDVIAVHLKGTFNLTKHAGSYWRALAKSGRRPHGRIINTTSGAGMRGNVGQSAYAAAKAAIALLTITSAMELAPYGVTVNAIAPVARTRMTGAVRGFIPEAPRGAFDPFAPENASPIVAYLASEQSSWISGQIIRIDGNALRFYRRWELSDLAYRPNEERGLAVQEIDEALRALYGAFPLGLTDARLSRA